MTPGPSKNHVSIVQSLMAELGVEPRETPSRKVVRHIGESLVGAMMMARQSDAPAAAAEIVGCECVVLAETKDHGNWELLSKCGDAAKGEEKKQIKAAIEAAEDEEDEHIYHSKGWCRELAIAALGMMAVLPPPEEQKDVKTAIDAARAKAPRKQMI